MYHKIQKIFAFRKNCNIRCFMSLLLKDENQVLSSILGSNLQEIRDIPEISLVLGTLSSSNCQKGSLKFDRTSISISYSRLQGLGFSFN